MEKEESRKIKRKMRGVGMGNVCGGDKSRKKKKGKETYGCKERGNNNNKK